jgi:hypothetical protein
MKAFNTFQMARKGRIIQFDIFMRGKNSKDLNCLGYRLRGSHLLLHDT